MCTRAHARTHLHSHKFVYISIFRVFVPPPLSVASRQSTEISILGSIDVHAPSVFTSHIGLARTHVHAPGCMHARTQISSAAGSPGDFFFLIFLGQMAPSDEWPHHTHINSLAVENKNDTFLLRVESF